MSELVRISATAAGLAYYPEQVARHLGFYEEEGLDVQTEAPGHGPWVARAVRTGTADLALGGIWRPILYRTGLDYFEPFVGIVARCPAVLLAREPMQNFKWTDLVGRRVAIPDGQAPTPLVAFCGILRMNGVDPSTVKLISYFATDEARDLFIGGACDFYIAGSPATDILIDQGKGFLVADLAEAGGFLPWSVYYSVPSFLKERGDVAIKFASATQRALNWIDSHDPEEAMNVLEKAWPSAPPKLLLAAARKSKAGGLWPKTVRVTEDHLERWQRILVGEGLFDEVLPYNEVFFDGPSKAAIAKYPPR